MDLVTITDGTRSYDFMLMDGVLLLEDIQPFFEKACALFYLFNERKITVSCRNGAFKIPDTVSSLEVICGQNASPTATKRTFDNAILSVIDKHKSKMQKTSKKKESRAVTIKKEIHLGWRHFKKNKYFAMNEATCNEKVLYLDENTEYSYEDILQQCIDKLSDAMNVNFFKHSTAMLGNFKEDMFTKFTDEAGKECHFWEFAHKLKQRNHYSLCVYTKPIENIDFQYRSAQKQPVRTILGNMNENNYEAEQSSKVDVKKTRYEGISNHDKENGERATERQSCSSANFTAASMFEEFLPLKDLEISTPVIKKEEITLTSKLLGQGSFGTVTQGKWKYTDVAVKTLRLGINSMKLCREIAVMDKIRHPNVIFIMAVAYDISHCYIVMEFFDSISLREFIFNPRIKNNFLITEDSIHDISKQICTAITYMHETVPKVIHQDLKPENILINDTLSVKICDMGHSKLSKMPENFKKTTGKVAQGTPPYMAPELLLLNQRASTHSDVWALACVLKELYSEQFIWPTFHIQDLQELFSREAQPDLSEVPKFLRALLSQCFHYVPHDRPKSRYLLKALEDYTKPKESDEE